MIQQKRLPKSIRLTDAQSKRLQELSELDGLDTREHAIRAIDEYLSKQRTDIAPLNESDINAVFTDLTPDPNTAGAFWITGAVGRYEFSAMVLKLPAKYGIDKGKLYKLFIYDPVVLETTGSFIGACIVNYDKGWDIRPSKIAEPYYNKVKALLDQSAEKYIKGLLK